MRTGGQQIDLKDQGIPIMQKLGLLETMRSHCVHETGMQVVDKNGKCLMQTGVTAAGDKGYVLTNEFEFMRGDIVRVVAEATHAERKKAEEKGVIEGGLTYVFGKTVTALDQSRGNGVDVTFDDEHTQRYDLVVGADGQASRTRRLAFGEEIGKAAFKSLGIDAAYYNVPRLDSEDSFARMYFAPGSRMIMTRTGDRPKTQVYLFLMKDKARSQKMKNVHRQPIPEQKKVWTSIYKGAGWETERFLDGMQTVDDFYACEIGQVKMPDQQLHKGRVVLLGDAGYCPSAFTGMGTTLSLIGSYILAGELARNGSGVSAALAHYTEIMRQPIDECQRLAPGSDGGFYPSSGMGIRFASNVLWTLSCLRLDKLVKLISGWLPQKETGWKIPEYAELGLDEAKK